MTKKILPKVVGCAIALAMLYVALPAAAAVVAISGTADTDDTFVSVVAGEVDLNFGASDTIVVGDPVIVINQGEPEEYSITETRYGLLKWDLSSLAALAGAGQRINVSSADVSISYTGTGEADTIVNLYFITEANADWVEGTGDGTTAVLHVEPSWCYKSQELMPWASALGGLVGATVDYEYDPNDPNTPEIDCSGNDQNGVSFTETVSIAAEKVEEWVNNPSTNGGLLLRQKTETDSMVNFVSSDSASPALLPVLTVTYTIGNAECGDIGTGQLVADLSGPNGEPDCKVDRYDLAAFVSEWLDCDHPNDPRCNN